MAPPSATETTPQLVLPMNESTAELIKPAIGYLLLSLTSAITSVALLILGHYVAAALCLGIAGIALYQFGEYGESLKPYFLQNQTQCTGCQVSGNNSSELTRLRKENKELQAMIQELTFDLMTVDLLNT